MIDPSRYRLSIIASPVVDNSTQVFNVTIFTQSEDPV